MDPVTHFSQSPYVSMSNNPINRIDPNGALDNPLEPGSRSGNFLSSVGSFLSSVVSAVYSLVTKVFEIILAESQESNPSPVFDDNYLKNLQERGINLFSKTEIEDFNYIFGSANALGIEGENNFISAKTLERLFYSMPLESKELINQLKLFVRDAHRKGIKLLIIATDGPLITLDGGKTYIEDPNLKFGEHTKGIGSAPIGGIFKKFSNVYVFNYSKRLNRMNKSRVILHEIGHGNAELNDIEHHGSEFHKWVNKLLRYYFQILKENEIEFYLDEEEPTKPIDDLPA